MFTDRQSLLLSGFVLIGFVITAVLGIFDNIFVAGILIIVFLLIIVNLFTTKRIPEAEENQEEELSAINTLIDKTESLINKLTQERE